MIVKCLSCLFNLDSLYPKLHLTVGGWEGGQVTVWTRFYWLQREVPQGKLLGDQSPERGSRAGMNSGLASQGRGRRGVGREKHLHTEGQRQLEFPKKYMLQGRRLK